MRNELNKLPSNDVESMALVRCSCESSHTPCPFGYVDWFDWAAEMSKTHKQIRCRGCGKFSVWIPN